MNEFQNSGKQILEHRVKATELVQDLKFPRIHHVFTESSHTSDDLIVEQQHRETFLKEFNSSLGVATEKIDGSNIGISFTPSGQIQLRHRGGACNDQDIKYKAAFEWVKGKQSTLEGILSTDAVLFIEWLEFNRGHVNYDDLSSYALAIALFDAREGEKGRYMSHRYINNILAGTGIAVVPTVDIAKPILTSADCLSQIKQSHFSSESRMEGLVLRIDDGDYNQEIMKFVSPHFRRSVDKSEHWAKTKLTRNKINYEKQAELLNL